MGIFNKKKGTVSPPDQWGAKTDQHRLLVDVDIPFVPDIHEVIYVENEFDPVVNDYIEKHYDELQDRFRQKNAHLTYLPKQCGRLIKDDELLYMFPFVKKDASFVNGDMPVEVIKQHIIEGAIAGPALLHRIECPDDDKSYYLSYRSLVPNSKVSLSDQFEWYLQHFTLAYGGGKVFFHLYTPEGDEVADYYFNSDDTRDLIASKSDRALTEEIRIRIAELRKRGVQQYLLRELVEKKPTLSRLVVDEEFRIFLPDYNNIEITMAPLPKAVYILFLLHPEGIPFKKLDYCFPELHDLYRYISNREIEENIFQSISDITDPTKNSINEKCSRIREAFLKHFDTTYAQYYYITGKRGEPKKITLPRELVDLQGLQNVVLRTALV